jgi:hypothetical protein
LPSAAKPEQIYKLRWNDRKAAQAAGYAIAATVIVTLQREEDPTSLLMTNPATREGKSLDGWLELQLCTLEDDDFWVDSGRFDIVWPDQSEV